MTTLKITGMTCDSCAVHVKEALEKVPGVQSAEVSYAKGSARLAIEADMRARPFGVLAAVGRDGTPQIKALMDGDKRLYDEPLY